MYTNITIAIMIYPAPQITPPPCIIENPLLYTTLLFTFTLTPHFFAIPLDSKEHCFCAFKVNLIYFHTRGHWHEWRVVF